MRWGTWPTPPPEKMHCSADEVEWSPDGQDGCWVCGLNGDPGPLSVSGAGWGSIQNAQYTEDTEDTETEEA